MIRSAEQLELARISYGVAGDGNLSRALEKNAIVLTREGIANGPLRYENDEFVRHKILDLIGDLALIGKRIFGRVVADRAGHAMHTALVSRLLRDETLWELTTLDEFGDAPEPVGSGSWQASR